MTDKLTIAPDVPLEKVEWRVDGKPFQWSGRDMCRFVPYMDGRDAARLLDEWVGPGNWSDEYIPTTGVDSKPAMWCHLSIKVGDEWVTKRDVGVASNFEAMKGIVSDAFKRAATIKWGVGRNVYDLPTINAPCDTWKDRNNKLQASPNDNTLPYILAELAKRGIEASSGRVSGSQVSQTTEPPTGSQASERRADDTGTAPVEAPQPEGDVSRDSSPSGSSPEDDLERQDILNALKEWVAGNDSKHSRVRAEVAKASLEQGVAPPEIIANASLEVLRAVSQALLTGANA